MTVLVYANSLDGSLNTCLFDAIASRVASVHLETVHDLQGLKARLHRLPREIDAAVLLAATAAELEIFIELRDFLEGIPIILILPDLERDTVAKATRLYPTFLSAVDRSLSLVVDVLERILGVREREFAMMQMNKTHKG